ncbi:hypothetical protein F4802DRAFT_293594 [Xylaria palmicola]|nr:hypothetical protein F4802DRAFT_293594 [Xylaria palmicola]
MSATNADSDDGSKPAAKPTGTITAKTKAQAADMLAYATRQVDRVVNPATRQKAINATTAFATRRPLLSLLLAAHLLTSLAPLVLFATFVLSTAALALVCAVAFTLFWIGLALLVLVPTLFLTCGLAMLVWLCAVGTYVVARAIYAKLPAGMRRDDGGGSHVIFSKDAAAPTHFGHGFDDAVNAEAAELRE